MKNEKLVVILVGMTIGVILAATAPPPVVRDVFAGLEAQTDQTKGRENLPKDIVLAENGVPIKFYVRFDYVRRSINPADMRDTFVRASTSDGMDLMADKAEVVTYKDVDGAEVIAHPYEAALILAAVAKKKYLERNPPPLPQERKRKTVREQNITAEKTP